ncbi:complex I NDUFA9 subunit family protein [Azospirillum sp. SYSU D00513]|uniref:complex I NDUFA9 subunit family protein n=1 Tax=Azospirillum sp. SYSU D00513 TaxID=2812561 RepID=UPI001A976799|nr:complex I NDUFA9 subunit family protein [Azospirillum sp. SYSU D00513]
MTYRSQVVTVFGGSGFIGRHLIRKIAKHGATVRIVSRHPGQGNYLRTAGSVGQIASLSADVMDDESVARVIKGSDIVINLIGALFERGPWSFDAVHVEAPARIARIAKAAGVQSFVHVSALGADEGSKSTYARSKAQGEKRVLEAFPEAVILRPSVVFGPDDRFFNKFAAMAQVMPVLPLVGGGETKFQPVYVGDLAEAIIRALQVPEAKGKTFALGGPRVYSFREMMELMLSEIRRKRRLWPVSWSLSETLGRVFEKIPVITPLVTRDQVELLKTDNVVPEDAPGFKELGMTELTSCEVMLPTYLHRFIVGGRNATLTRDVSKFNKYPSAH